MIWICASWITGSLLLGFVIGRFSIDLSKDRKYRTAAILFSLLWPVILVYSIISLPVVLAIAAGRYMRLNASNNSSSHREVDVSDILTKMSNLNAGFRERMRN